jgi:hypothetical protein
LGIRSIEDLDFSLSIYNSITHPTAIEKYIKHNIVNFFKTFTFRKNIKCIVLSKMYMRLATNRLLSVKPSEIIITLGGYNDGIRKAIWADSADFLINQLEQMMPYDQLYNYICAISPFILDFWNCKYGIIYCSNINLESLFNKWNIWNNLNEVDDCIIGACHYCAMDITLLKNGETSMICKTCGNLFHNLCFNQEKHLCKTQHYEEDVDFLTQQMSSM